LKHGHPILVNNLESLRKLVENYKVGVVIQEPSNNIEIESAIEKILNNYSFYSENARKCFEEVFDFDKKIKPILSFMANL
jgi:glycosyltransferase involved in cell wall biosynthesis